jgi:sialidase-1
MHQLLALARITLAAPPISATAGLTSEPRTLFQSTPFASNTHGYRTFRIPTLLAVNDPPRIMVFAEGRIATARPPVGNVSICYGVPASFWDGGCRDKDIVMRASSTGGRTWGSIQTIAAGNESHVVGNPVAVVRSDPQVVFLTYSICKFKGPGECWGDATVMLVESAATDRSSATRNIWSAPRPIASGLMSVGAGIELRHGSHRGRLLLPQSNNGLVSDDRGQTWVQLPRAKEINWSGGESVIAELSNGSLLMETRVSVLGGPGVPYNGTVYDSAWARSDSSGALWTEYQIGPRPNVVDCAGDDITTTVPR